MDYDRHLCLHINYFGAWRTTVSIVHRIDADGRKYDKDGRELVAVLDTDIYMHKDVIDRIERDWEAVFGKPIDTKANPVA
jgi:hypothetical protein